ncbi:uncharacterized protein FA14DRAFT_180233 [Meira miltonrushii]|uniref:HTH psq-type domain-containing protein n=1 Tax=Meira miltonrushii TaxID=1280837 RepID=A0A316V8P6_9BASI|nr:uncharacterized protein FA14DRAFT_180233 [Meira miltonrushii]PWN33594.1 hypothetical protein FA14DRAFT_180233 [Meira miltonrushii]
MAPEIERSAGRTSKVRTSIPFDGPRDNASPRPASQEPERSSPPPPRPIVEGNVQNGNPSTSRPEKRPADAEVGDRHPPINTPEQSQQSTAHSDQTKEEAEEADQSTTSNVERSRSSSSPHAYKKRRTITQFEKIEICKKAKDIYLSHKKIADMFGIERTAVTKIVKESDYWLSLKGEDLSEEGMNRIRRTTDDYKRSKGIPESGPSLHMQPQFLPPYHLQHQQPPHLPMGFPPPFVAQRCDHQVQIARLQDVVGTLQRYHKGTEDAVERIEKVIESLMQNH